MAKRKNNGNKAQALVPTSRAMFKPAGAYNNNKKPKGAVANARFRQQRRGRAVPPSHLPQVLSAYIDPWGDNADGARYPDDFRGYSGTFSSTLEGRLTTPLTFTDANMSDVTATPGTCLQVFTPDPSNAVITGVCGTSASGAFAGSPNQFHWPNGIKYTGETDSLNAFGPGTGLLDKDICLPNVSAMRNMYSGARLVSGGVRLSGTMNFSTVSGTVHMAPVFVSLATQTTTGAAQPGIVQDSTLVNMQNGWQCTLPANVADMCNLPGYVSYPLSALQSDEVSAIFKRFSVESLTYKSTNKAWGMTTPQFSSDVVGRYGDGHIGTSIGHYCLMMFIDGVLNAAGAPTVPGTALAEFEMRNHYECEFNAASSASLGGWASNSGVATKAPPSQPLLMAAYENLAADVPAVRIVDDAGSSEASFMQEVSRAWKGAVGVASSVATAVEIGSGLLAMLAI